MNRFTSVQVTKLPEFSDKIQDLKNRTNALGKLWAGLEKDLGGCGCYQGRWDNINSFSSALRNTGLAEQIPQVQADSYLLAINDRDRLSVVCSATHE